MSHALSTQCTTIHRRASGGKRLRVSELWSALVAEFSRQGRGRRWLCPDSGTGSERGFGADAVAQA